MAYCNGCGAELQGRYCQHCGRANPAWRSARRAPLERPRQGRKVAGVCLAFANALNRDPTLVRVVWAVVTAFLAVAPGLVAYLLAWILIPEAPELAAEEQPSPAPANN